MAETRRICLVPQLSGIGGMVSFQQKMAAGLTARGIQVGYDLDGAGSSGRCDAVLVIGGIRHLRGLWRVRQQGIPIVQRLNGMNWMHRVPAADGGRRTGLRHFLRSEYGNWLLSLIRSRFASYIVYQSEFSHRWWERVYGPAAAPHQIIYNGVDLRRYTPQGTHQRPEDRWRLLLVEGSLKGGYEMGLEIAAQLAAHLSQGEWPARLERPLELMVVGQVSPEVQRQWSGRFAGASGSPDPALVWAGAVPQAQIPEIDRSAHVLFSADINAACPNSVVEALACGLPVASYATGALAELVSRDAGKVVPYGGDPWRLDRPDIPALAQATAEILLAQSDFRCGARRRAEAAFGLDKMVEDYLDVLLGAV